MKPSNDTSNDGCGCAKTRRRWRWIRLALLLAGASLAFYMPWKALTQFEKLESIYGPWFLQGAVVTVAGLFFVLKPGFAARVPLVLRIGVAASAVLWMRTGLMCTPHLFELTQTTPAQGLFASFHMFVQHIFLSAGVIAFAAVPQAMAARMDSPVLGETAEEQPVGETAAG